MLKYSLLLYLGLFCLSTWAETSPWRDPTCPYGYQDSTKLPSFAKDLVLTAIMHQTAYINNQAYTVGSVVSKLQVVAINPDSVQLQGPEGEYKLVLYDNVKLVSKS